MGEGKEEFFLVVTEGAGKPKEEKVRTLLLVGVLVLVVALLLLLLLIPLSPLDRSSRARTVQTSCLMCTPRRPPCCRASLSSLLAGRSLATPSFGR